MDRIGLTAYLATEYDTLLVEAGIAPTDTVDGLASVLDAVSGIVAAHPELSVVWQRLLGSYYLLDRIVKRFAVNMNVSISGDSYSLQQQFANAKALRDEAYQNVAWLVDPLIPIDDPNAGGRIVTIEMPFLTQSEEEYTSWW